MKNINYVNSYLDMSMGLGKKRTVYTKASVVEDGKSVTPVMKMTVPDNLFYLEKVVSQINTNLVAKTINLPKHNVSTSRYKVNIT